MTDRPARTDAPLGWPARRRGPARRPPLGVRACAALGGFATGALTTALMLSDRAPGVLEQLFGERIERLWRRVDAAGQTDFVTADRVAEGDQIVHIAMWAVVMLLIGITVWSWRGLLVAAVSIACVSAVVEVGQGRWADTRSVEASDAVANLAGVGLGAGCAGLLYLCWSAAARLMGLTRGVSRMASDTVRDR